MPSLLVLTGVSGPADLLAGHPERRPTYVAADLSGLFRPAADARFRSPAGELGGWQLDRDGTSASLSGSGDPVAALRLLCGATWDGVPAEALHTPRRKARSLFAKWGLTARRGGWGQGGNSASRRPGMGGRRGASRDS